MAVRKNRSRHRSSPPRNQRLDQSPSPTSQERRFEPPAYDGVSLFSPVFWKQVRALTRANIKARYRKTVAGFVWVVLNPLIMYGVQSQIFSRVLKVPVSNFFLFLLSGLLPWIFIVQCFEMCTSILVVSGRLLKSFNCNPLVLLVAQLADNTINFLAAFILIFIPVWLAHPGRAIGLVFAPLAIGVLVTGVFGACWLLATAQVFLRDTRFMVQFGTSIMFFLTPIFYPPSMVPPNLRWMVEFNPMYRLIEPLRIVFYSFDGMALAVSMGKAVALSTALLALAAWVWKRQRNYVYLNV